MRPKSVLQLTVLTIGIFPITAVVAIGQGGSANAAYQPPRHQTRDLCICAPKVARDVGALLIRSNFMIESDQSLFAEFRALIEANATVLRRDGPIVGCMRDLGKALVEQGISQFSRQDYDDAYESVLSQGGTIDQAQSVAESMINGSVDAFITGKELYWLATVLPAASGGDWVPYWNTATESRSQARQGLAIIISMPDMREMIPMVHQMFTRLEPLVQNQMVMASCLLGA